ncbi:MAG: putative glycoside hydrolase, partial [Novosphingobium sp.]
DGPQTQEGALRLNWTGTSSASLAISGPRLDLTRETNADLVLRMLYRVVLPPSGRVTMGMAGGAVDLTGLLGQTSGWQTLRIPLKCLREAGAQMAGVEQPWLITAAAPFALSLAEIKLDSDPAGATCPAAVHP